MSFAQTLFEDGQSQSLVAGELLFVVGQRVRSVYLVTEGLIELVRHSESGNRMVLFRARSEQILAEASAYSDAYHCDGIAASNACVSFVPVETFRSKLALDVELAKVWSAKLAHSLQLARLQSEIRGLRTVAERLDAWLDDKPLPPKGEWQRVAQELGVSREALYRELAKRR